MFTKQCSWRATLIRSSEGATTPAMVESALRHPEYGVVEGGDNGGPLYTQATHCGAAWQMSAWRCPALGVWMGRRVTPSSACCKACETGGSAARASPSSMVSWSAYQGTCAHRERPFAPDESGEGCGLRGQVYGGVPSRIGRHRPETLSRPPPKTSTASACRVVDIEPGGGRADRGRGRVPDVVGHGKTPSECL